MKKVFTYNIMEAFPELSGNQVALLRAEFTTGHVLDELFVLAIHDSQKTYTVVETLSDAIELSKKIVLGRNDVECVVYGKNKEVLYDMDRDKVNAS